MKHRIPLILVVLSNCLATAVLAEEGTRPVDSEAGIVFFETKIRPILAAHCYECHATSEGTSEGELTLDSREGMRRGGTRGPAVIPGNVAASWLLTSVSHSDPDLQMPPKRPRLPEAVIKDLKRWIEMGAPDPRSGTAGQTDGNRNSSIENFWAYQRPVAVAPPVAQDSTWGKRSIDAFILHELNEHGLHPSPDAEPQTLLRRLYFDLIGFQPHPEELGRFLSRVQKQGMDAALEIEVDRLMASSQFGECWGRHWLDVARFAESSGTEANISFPYAWRYRDYVIDSVNNDTPYNRFLTEQLAGDLLPYDSEKEHARLLIATGFLAVGPKNLDSTDQRQFQADLIDEQIDAISRAILGTSIACARCHNHKSDPISMRDYYALAGIFASTKTFFGTAVSPSNRIGGDPLLLPEIEGQIILHASIPADQVAKLKKELAGLKAEQAEIDAAVRDVLAGKKPNREVTIQDALRIFWSAGRIEGELEKVSETGKALPLAMGVHDAEQIIDLPLLERGDINKPKEKVSRAIPAMFRSIEAVSFPADQSGRLELARWLTSESHPLTSRVFVNRIWHQLFGRGLVATVDQFGVSGDHPSHPELLDTLAVEFVKNNWSLKSCVREIVLSRTYRQASDYRADAFQVDPENKYLWRVSKRRLQAEAIRDAMLVASGELDLRRPVGSLVGRMIGDKPISLIGLDKRLPADLDGSLHRSVYLPVIRDRLPDVLDLFDFAEPSLVSGQRDTTNVPTQSLYLMNSSFIQERAKALARRVKEAADTPSGQAKLAFLICLNREPEEDELAISCDFLNRQSPVNEAAGEQVSSALIDYCQALLCTGEFLNLD